MWVWDADKCIFIIDLLIWKQLLNEATLAVFIQILNGD